MSSVIKTYFDTFFAHLNIFKVTYALCILHVQLEIISFLRGKNIAFNF